MRRSNDPTGGIGHHNRHGKDQGKGGDKAQHRGMIAGKRPNPWRLSFQCNVRFTPESGHFNVAGAYSLLPDDLARDQPVGTAPFGTRSKEILMRCISELKGMVR